MKQKFDHRSYYKPKYVDVLIGENVLIDERAIVGLPTPSNNEPVILGDNVHIHSGVVIYAGCRIGNRTHIYHNTVLMENVIVGCDTKIGALCHLQGNLEIGNFVTVASHCHLTSFMKIEDGVFLSLGIFTGNHLNPGGRLHKVNTSQIQGPVIKKGARIGGLSMINPGITIGQEALVGSGSVVRKDVPDFKIAFGNPVKIIGEIEESEKIDWEKVYETMIQKKDND